MGNEIKKAKTKKLGVNFCNTQKESKVQNLK